MPSIQRPVDRAEPADDDELRTCRFERQFAKVKQNERVCRRHILLFPWVFLMHDVSAE